MAADELLQLEINDRQTWRKWLFDNHATVAGVWLVLFKKSSGKARLSYDYAVEEALCFGWIDSQERSLDAERVLLKFTPRKPGGTWAASNKARIERLIAAGLMTPAGQAIIDAAQADGSWTLLDTVDALIVPDDLAAALAERAGARDSFDRLGQSARKQMLYSLVTAKRPVTRQKRVAAIVAEVMP